MRYEKKGRALSAAERTEYESRGILPMVAELLAARGIPADQAEAFLNPGWEQVGDPFAFLNMEKSCARVLRAAEQGERVAIYSDYDCDGVCGAAILQKALTAIGLEPVLYIPDRASEGYGTNAAAFTRLIEGGVTLIITVDCGIRSVSDIALAKERGADCIIIDHHECGELPDTPYLLNCKMPGESYPFGDLCGAGTAFKVAQALLGAGAEEFIDLCGVATIGDMVSLTGENRALAYLGLKKLRQAPCLGFQVLAEAAGLRLANIQSYGVAFGLVPRINAAGRLEHAGLALELLTTADAGRAKELAEHLSGINSRRQDLQKSITQQAMEQVRQEVCLADARILFVSGQGWEKGVVGLAASSITQAFYRPAVVLSEEDGMLTGSARSIPGVNLYEALCRAEHLYERFGGHEMAAGLTLKKQNLAEVQRIVQEFLSEKYPEEAFLPAIQYDQTLKLGEADIVLAEQMEKLQPFGQDNEEPRFYLENFQPLEIAKMGKTGEHLKMTAADCPSEVLRFSAREEIQKGAHYDCIASFSINEFRGSRKSQLILSSLQERGEVDWPKRLEKEYLRLFPAEALAYAAFLENPSGEILSTPGQLEQWMERQRGHALGGAVFCGSYPGAVLLRSKRAGYAEGWAERRQAAADSAESCFCYLQRQPLRHYRNMLALGDFALLARQPDAAVYLGEDLRTAYRAEAKAFYAPGLLAQMREAFEKAEGVYASVSEFLEKAAMALGLPDIKKPWLYFQGFFEQKLIEVRKSDKIIQIHLKEEPAFCPEQSAYFRAMGDLAEGRI